MGPCLVRGRRPGHAGADLSAQPWWFGPAQLPPPEEGAPFDLVLLDRDGTLNVRVPDGYVTRPEQLELLPGAADAVARLTRAGCRTVLVTNQRGIARGLMDREDLVAVHARLADLLAVSGARLDAVVVCPHDRDACTCRKPMDGLFRTALSHAPWALPGRCVMIGDMPSDLDPARGLGMRAERVGDDRPMGDLTGSLLRTGRHADQGIAFGRGEGHVPYAGLERRERS